MLQGIELLRSKTRSAQHDEQRRANTITGRHAAPSGASRTGQKVGMAMAPVLCSRRESFAIMSCGEADQPMMRDLRKRLSLEKGQGIRCCTCTRCRWMDPLRKAGVVGGRVAGSRKFRDGVCFRQHTLAVEAEPILQGSWARASRTIFFSTINLRRMTIMVQKNHAFTKLNLATAGIEPFSKCSLQKILDVYSLHLIVGLQ